MSAQWEYDLQNASDSPIYKGDKEEEEELSPCCSAPIIHHDICSECREHI